MRIIAPALVVAAALTGVAVTAGTADAANQHPGHRVTVLDRPGSRITVVNHDNVRHVVRATVRCTSGPWRGWAGTGTYRVAAHETRTWVALQCPNVLTRARVTH